ncbi:hypothetical protein [Neisseria flavescens]|uniref:hypothetical protein n=1 Tax=Neisseria flavescens TaxID=484 RepID=UPI0012E938C8|nr:hypothetical protein [Neisseria flavescens]
MVSKRSPRSVYDSATHAAPIAPSRVRAYGSHPTAQPTQPEKPSALNRRRFFPFSASVGWVKTQQNC